MLSSRNRFNTRKALALLIIIAFFVTLIFLNYVLFSARALLYEQSLRNQVAPIPGKFLWNFPLNNESYCNFKYGLPNRLTFTEELLRYPPQHKANSSYRVLYNVVEAYLPENVPKVTYVTHITVDFVLFIPEIVRHWQGPISIAAFVPAQDATIFFQKLYQICFCLREMSRVSIHLVFPISYQPYVEETLNSSKRFQDCKLNNEFNEKVNRVSNGLYYPINIGRNVARKAANTHYIMVSDIELIPSNELARRFMKLMKFFQSPESRRVFVVPTFEIECGYEMPLTKRDLSASANMGMAVYFHKFLCPHCQKFPGLDTWLEIPDGNEIRPFLSVKREYPYHRWEPIFIGTRQEPLYDEELSWEGLQDKMPQMLQMCLLNYSFIILDGAFLVHWPGIKRRPLRNTDGWKTPFIKKNSDTYGRIIKHLSSIPEYTKKRRCRLQ